MLLRYYYDLTDYTKGQVAITIKSKKNRIIGEDYLQNYYSY